MRHVRIYSRPGCHLCELLIEEAAPLVRGRAVLEVVNIDARDDWREEFDTRIPVVEIGGRFVCQFRLDRDALERALRECEAADYDRESGSDSSSVTG